MIESKSKLKKSAGRPYKSLSKQRIRNVLNDALDELNSGKRPNLYALQIKHGYSESSSRAYKVLRTNTWQRELEKVNDARLLNRLEDIGLYGKENNSISAIREIFKLKGRFPGANSGGISKDIADIIELE